MSAPASQDMDRLAEALARLLAAYWRRYTSSSDPQMLRAGEPQPALPSASGRAADE